MSPRPHTPSPCPTPLPGHFRPAEVEALARSAEPPPGYTWHHHQDVGRMQLVSFEAHRMATPHTGGMAIWGGGHR
ncbi:MAG TPA: HNH endonuclease [Myxococcaceae bacterium]|nr:HNH endonuclease [Myxococcaceae bacterium]